MVSMHQQDFVHNISPSPLFWGENLDVVRASATIWCFCFVFDTNCQRLDVSSIHPLLLLNNVGLLINSIQPLPEIYTSCYTISLTWTFYHMLGLRYALDYLVTKVTLLGRNPRRFLPLVCVCRTFWVCSHYVKYHRHSTHVLRTMSNISGNWRNQNMLTCKPFPIFPKLYQHSMRPRWFVDLNSGCYPCIHSKELFFFFVLKWSFKLLSSKGIQ